MLNTMPAIGMDHEARLVNHDLPQTSRNRSRSRTHRSSSAGTSSETRSKKSHSSKKVSRTIRPTANSMNNMRRVSTLGMEDPVFDRIHEDLEFEESSFGDVVGDMCDTTSIASDPTACMDDGIDSAIFHSSLSDMMQQGSLSEFSQTELFSSRSLGLSPAKIYKKPYSRSRQDPLRIMKKHNISLNTISTAEETVSSETLHSAVSSSSKISLTLNDLSRSKSPLKSSTAPLGCFVEIKNHPKNRFTPATLPELDPLDSSSVGQDDGESSSCAEKAVFSTSQNSALLRNGSRVEGNGKQPSEKQKEEDSCRVNDIGRETSAKQGSVDSGTSETEDLSSSSQADFGASQASLGASQSTTGGFLLPGRRSSLDLSSPRPPRSLSPEKRSQSRGGRVSLSPGKRRRATVGSTMGCAVLKNLTSPALTAVVEEKTSEPVSSHSAWLDAVTKIKSAYAKAASEDVKKHVSPEQTAPVVVEQTAPVVAEAANEDVKESASPEQLAPVDEETKLDVTVEVDPQAVVEPKFMRSGFKVSYVVHTNTTKGTEQRLLPTIAAIFPDDYAAPPKSTKKSVQTMQKDEGNLPGVSNECWEGDAELSLPGEDTLCSRYFESTCAVKSLASI